MKLIHPANWLRCPLFHDGESCLPHLKRCRIGQSRAGPRSSLGLLLGGVKVLVTSQPSQLAEAMFPMADYVFGR